MVKHRYYLPGLIILSSLLGLFPTVVDIGKYGPVRLFIPTVGEGLLIGTALFILCASCIKKSQSDGVIYLGWAVTFAVLFYVATIISGGWLVYTRMSWICPFLMTSDPNQCAIAFSVFRSTVELSFLVEIYIWGLIYEKQIGRSLVYRKGPSIWSKH